MSNLMNDEELREFGELARKLIKVEGSNDVNCGWFKVTFMSDDRNRVWIHKFGATIYIYDDDTTNLNKYYSAEAWCAYRYLQGRLVLDNIVESTDD